MAIICIALIFFLIIETGFFICFLRQRNSVIKQNFCQMEKYRILFDLSADWFIGHLNGKSITKWIVESGYKNIAIYGMGALGELTFLSMSGNETISIRYGLDRRTKVKIPGLKIYSLNDNLEAVDLIIVTAVTSFEKIEAEINRNINFNCKVISLGELLEKMYIE